MNSTCGLTRRTDTNLSRRNVFEAIREALDSALNAKSPDESAAEKGLLQAIRGTCEFPVSGLIQ